MLTSASLTLVLGATGKTGSRVANRLLSRGLPVRTAARSGADAHFDWDDRETYAPALHGIKRVYLLGPVMRTDFADQVSVFLDQAEAAGARHVTYLSAYGIDSAPPETAMRSVELDLLGRPGLTHAILRPAWFMQIISDVSGQAIDHTDIDRGEWVAAAVAGGVPAEYGAVLRMLTETIASGHGSRPNSDVEKATGAAPASFADFARRTAAAWAVDVAR